MGSFSINSYQYYNLSTGTFGKQFGGGYNTIVSTYEEVSPNVDGFARPGEEMDPDYSTLPATYIGLYNDGTNTFIVMEDEFGYYLSSPNSLTEPQFPETFQQADIDTSSSATTVACFLTGTAISTPSGPVPVEELSIGDHVLTAEGTPVEVRWIGRQTVSTLFGIPERLSLVRVRAGILGQGLPHRDLILTADHALVIDGHLVNAGALVNGAGIEWVPIAELGNAYTVYHVETGNHDIILAEGAPAETFIDYVSRRCFDNFGEYEALYGSERTIPEMQRLRLSAARLVPRDIRARFRTRKAG